MQQVLLQDSETGSKYLIGLKISKKSTSPLQFKRQSEKLEITKVTHEDRQ
jgi:hypothetical protein